MPANPTLSLLQDANGEAVIVQEGESCNLTFVPLDIDGVAVPKVGITSLILTLYDLKTSATINDRLDQNMIDLNDGSVATNGTLTVRLGPLDNVIVGTVPASKTESHVVQIAYTWNDGVGVRTGKSDPRILLIQQLVEPT